MPGTYEDGSGYLYLPHKIFSLHSQFELTTATVVFYYSILGFTSLYLHGNV